MKALKFFVVSMLVESMVDIYKSRFVESSFANILLWFCEFVAGEIDEGWIFLFLDSFLKQSDVDMKKILDSSEHCHGYLLMTATHVTIFR